MSLKRDVTHGLTDLLLFAHVLLALDERVAAEVRSNHIVLFSRRVVRTWLSRLSHSGHPLLLVCFDASSLNMVTSLLLSLHLVGPYHSTDRLALLSIDRGVLAPSGRLADRIDLAHLDHRSLYLLVLDTLLVLHSPICVVPLILHAFALTLVIRRVDCHLLHLRVLDRLPSRKHHRIHIVDVHLLELRGLQLLLYRFSGLADVLLFLSFLGLLDTLEPSK